MAFRDAARSYYVLSKPGIVYANVLTALAGYLYASALQIAFGTLLGLLIGTTALIAGACAYNNYLDRKIDMRMARTRKRPSVTGTLTPWQILLFASLMTVTGLLTLAVTQNTVTLLLGITAFVDYVIVYGIAKRTTTLSTLIGTVSGAIPLVMGYTSVTGSIDTAAWLLFLLMATWQMAHFYAIGLYRLDDYRAAGLPIMSVRYGAKTTIRQTVVYIGLFIVCGIAMIAIDAIGRVAGCILVAASAWWLYQALKNYGSTAYETWGRQIFFASLRVLLIMVACLSVGSLLP